MRGKVHSKRTREKISGDHPRLCGEKIPVMKLRNASLGSPPPMRGKVLLLKSPLFSRGITPAYAGKSIMLDGYKDNP